MTYQQYDAYTPYVVDDNSLNSMSRFFSPDEHDFNGDFASTSSWVPEHLIKQSSSPANRPSYTHPTFHEAPLPLPTSFQFQTGQDDYDAYTRSSWHQQFPIHTPPDFLGDLGTAPDCWSPYAETPDLQYSSSSASSESSTNVFDVQFGQSLQSGHVGYSTQRFTSEQATTPPFSPEPTSKLSNASNSSEAELSRRRHPCLIPGCLRRFTSQYTLKVHLQAHKPKPRVSFFCTLGCGERFSRQHDRLRHEVAKHNKVCEFSCDACGRFFSTGKTLGNHKCPFGQGGTRWVHH